MPFFMLKKVDVEEKVGEMVEMLLNAEEAMGYPPGGEDIVLVRELSCRVLRCLFAWAGGLKSKARMGAN